uniref:Unannotated protein n=1 Tax=freshwater metagenome TaxID=449393 RepID=A0A6J6A1V8_9ZZZZ
MRRQLHGSGSLAPDDDGVVALRAAFASFKAEAGVEPLEAGNVGEVAGPPLLVVDEQQRRLPDLAAADQGPQGTQSQCHPALHVVGPGADELVAHSPWRQECVMRDDGVEVADEKDPFGTVSVDGDDDVGSVFGSGTGDPLNSGIGRRERGDKRNHPLCRLRIS